MSDNPYPKWMQKRCRYCAAGVPKGNTMRSHSTGGIDKVFCTAPIESEYIAELEAKLSTVRMETAKRCADIASQFGDSYSDSEEFPSLHAVGAETVAAAIRQEFGL